MTECKTVQFKNDDEKVTEDSNKATAGGREQMLSFGYACVNADPVERELVVVNNGSMPGKISWKIRAQTGELNGPVKVSINVEENEVEDEATGNIKEELKVRAVLGFWADD